MLYHFRLAWLQPCPRGAARASRRWPRGCRKPCGTSAARDHRTDSLSAAFRNLSKDAVEDITGRYRALCEHYGMEATRNNRGVAHENGSIEGPPPQAPDRRCAGAARATSRISTPIAASSPTWSAGPMRTAPRRSRRAVLLDLPVERTVDYEQISVNITSSSGFGLRRVFYTLFAT